MKSARVNVAIAVALGVLCLAGSAGAQLPAHFTDTTVVSGLVRPTALAVAPDGRILISEQDGSLRVVKNGKLLAAPFVHLDVSSVGERGLLGIAFDPGFGSANHYVYGYYTVASPTHNRVSRFTAHGDVALAGSEHPILDLPTTTNSGHQGGGLRFGKDGLLYVSVGDNGNHPGAQSLANPFGKILRITKYGGIPSSNPFYGTATGQNRSIWAYGLRNPFNFDVQPGTGRILINDVGQTTWEEVDGGVAGANYGWPATEGPTSNPAYVSPLYWYAHGFGETTGSAITGGAFYNPSVHQFGTSYLGSYFYADYASGWIRRLLPPGYTSSTAFATSHTGRRIVALAVAPDGSLYYLDRGPDSAPNGTLHRISRT